MKQNIKLLFFAFLFCLVLSEITFRVSGKYISYAERAGYGGYVSPFNSDNGRWIQNREAYAKRQDVNSEYDYSWVSNNEGLRDRNLSVQKQGNRLFIFGDSFTEGSGAPDDSTYPRILEKLIRSGFDSTAQVVNCGISSADIFTEYRLLSKTMLRYSPDYVLVTFNSTDFYDFICRGGFERFVGNDEVKYRDEPWFEPLYANSYLVRRIVHDAFKYNYTFLQPEEQSMMTDSANKMITQAMDSFQNLCNENNIRFGIIFHPQPPEMQKSVNYKCMDQLIAHCKQKGILYNDERLFLSQQKIDSTNYRNIYWSKDGHFNSRGYELLAHCAYDLIRQNSFFTAY